MKKNISALLALAGMAAALGLAPLADADMNVVQGPGNAQVTATPGEAAVQAGQLQYPWYEGGGLDFHHGGHR